MIQRLLFCTKANSRLFSTSFGKAIYTFKFVWVSLLYTQKD